ncbi:hypothetical protein M4D50_01050 [Rothia sp. p3-SID1597]|nr:hypothetical protein [Rothia sp. p3-SID1597]
MVSYEQGKKDARELSETAKDEETRRLAEAVLALYEKNDEDQRRMHSVLR